MKLIKEYSNGIKIEVGPGKFDDYCVYVTNEQGRRKAPCDVEYFSFFVEKSKIHTNSRIYSDFVKIYDMTTGKIEQEVLNDIERISINYQKDSQEFDLWFTVIYLGMVAEELKKFAILKKRIKRLGMYQILMENMCVDEAASFSKGRKVAELSPLCKSKGF